MLADLQVPPNRAVWIVPTEDFQRSRYVQRDWAHTFLPSVPEPQSAFDRWMQRDAQFAIAIADQARALGYHVLVTDGSTSAAAMAETVSAMLGQPAP